MTYSVLFTTGCMPIHPCVVTELQVEPTHLIRASRSLSTTLNAVKTEMAKTPACYKSQILFIVFIS